MRGDAGWRLVGQRRAGQDEPADLPLRCPGGDRGVDCPRLWLGWQEAEVALSARPTARTVCQLIVQSPDSLPIEGRRKKRRRNSPEAGWSLDRISLSQADRNGREAARAVRQHDRGRRQDRQVDL